MTEKALRSAVAEIWKMSLEYDACLCLTDRKELDELHRREKNAAAGYLDLLAAGLESVTGLPREGEPCKLLALRLPQRLQLAALYLGGLCRRFMPVAPGVDPYGLLPVDAWDLFDGRAEVAFDSRRRNSCNDEAAKAFAFYLPRWMPEGGAA